MSQNPIVRFIVSLYRFVRGFIFIVGFLVIAGLVLFCVKFNEMSFESPDYGPEEQIVLKLKLDGALLTKAPDMQSYRAYFMRFLKGEEHEYYVPYLKDTLKHAKTDPQVQGLVLEFSSLLGSLAEFGEFRKALVDFKSSGKRVEFWSSDLDNKSFYLATAADRILYSGSDV